MGSPLKVIGSGAGRRLRLNESAIVVTISAVLSALGDSRSLVHILKLLRGLCYP